MKKSILYTLGFALALAGCKKDENIITTPDTDLAYVSFVNANASSKTVDVYVDTNKVNATGIGAFGVLNGVYAGVKGGTRKLIIRDVSTVIPPVEYYNSNISVQAGKSYTFFQYGLLTGGMFKGILLSNDRTDDTNMEMSKMRFLNISNGAPLLDLLAVRREGTVDKDSVLLFTAAPSLATLAQPDANALSAYKLLAGNRPANYTPGSAVSTYILKLKLSGTNTLVSASAATTIAPARSYTYFARGNYPSTVLTGMLDD